MPNFKENLTGYEKNLSKEQVIANKFIAAFNNGKYSDLVLTIENIPGIKAQIKTSWGKLAPIGSTCDDKTVNLIIDLLKKQKLINPTPKIVEILEKKEEEIFKTDSEKNMEGIGLTQVDVTEEQLKILQANLLYEETRKQGIFKDSKEIDEIYKKTSIISGLEKVEKSEYPYEPQDLLFLENILKDIEERIPKDPAVSKRYLESKKIATIVERAISYCFKNGLFGDKIKMLLTSLFDDVRSGVDEIILIEKSDLSHDKLGLGIDATFSGLNSDFFEHKFNKLLKSIEGGYKTKIKYFKDQNGEMVNPFFIPKIILHFDINDIKELVGIIKNAGDEKESERIKNSYLKSKIMSQIINSCNILADFAYDSNNSIFRDYNNVILSLKELSLKDEEIKNLINNCKEDEVSQRLKYLIEKYSGFNNKG